MGGQLGFLLTQIAFKPRALPADVRFDKQTAIITGSNVGIGLETARQLASHGVSRVILGVRDLVKGTTAQKDLAKSSPGCDFHVWLLDLESPDSIDAFAKRANSLDRLDIAILNAAVKQLKFTTTPSGHETNVCVNHTGTALLSLLLLPILKSTSQELGQPSRLTFTSTEGHFWTPFSERKEPKILERMDQKTSFTGGIERYYTSKLLNLLWYRELASRIDSKDIIINGTNPGLVATQLHRHDSSTAFKVLQKLLAWTPEQGAYFMTDAVTKQTDSHGAYIQEQKVTKPSPFVLSGEGKDTQKKLWKETIALLKQESPDIDLDSVMP